MSAHRHTQTHTHRHTHTQAGRQAGRQTDRQTHTHRHTHTHSHTHTHTDTHRHTDTHTHIVLCHGNSSHLKLSPQPSIDPAKFEQLWMSLEIGAVVKDVFRDVPTASTPSHVEKAMARFGISLMASSPPQADTIKFFFFAQEVCACVCECVILCCVLVALFSP